MSERILPKDDWLDERGVLRAGRKERVAMSGAHPAPGWAKLWMCGFCYAFLEHEDHFADCADPDRRPR